MSVEQWWIVLTGQNRSLRRKTCHSATPWPEIPHGISWN